MLLRENVIVAGGAITTESLSAGKNETLFRVIVRVAIHIVLIMQTIIRYLLSYWLTTYIMECRTASVRVDLDVSAPH